MDATIGRTQLRLYTHNIFARRAGWSERRALLREGVEQLRPDVVLFQEEVLGDEFDQTSDILGPGFHIAHSAGRSSQESSGISIASRWPISAVHEINLTDGGPPVEEFVWTTLIATIDTHAGPVVVANHFPDATVQREAERVRQAALAARALEQLAAPDVPVVIAGDFDAEPDAASLRLLLGKEPVDDLGIAYIRAWDSAHPGRPCVTFNPENPLHAMELPGWPFTQIDHVLVRCLPTGLASLRVDACEMVHDIPRNGVWASDHVGLVADLSF